MQEYGLFIKGMVCQRCIMTVQQELEKLGLQVRRIQLGEVTVAAAAPPDADRVNKALQPLGFELLEDRNSKQVTALKALVAEAYSGDFDFPDHFRFSRWAADRLQKDYAAMSAVFSATEGITLEKYIMEYRIEKVKEWLVYTELTLADIAFKLNFNNEAHLSRQFKSYTGLTPSFFKKIKRDKAQLSGQTGNGS